MPSLRYIVHLEAPGLDVIGAGEPALPGVSSATTRRIAFGITIFMTDQADLYVYELNPANPRQYRYGDGWEDMRFVHETVPVKGEAPREVELAVHPPRASAEVDPRPATPSPCARSGSSRGLGLFRPPRYQTATTGRRSRTR